MFMENLGIRPADPVLIGDLDRARDVETIGGAEEKIREALRFLLLETKDNISRIPHR